MVSATLGNATETLRTPVKRHTSSNSYLSLGLPYANKASRNPASTLLGPTLRLSK